MHVQRVTSTTTYITSPRYDSHTLTAYTSGRNDVIFARNRNQKWLLSAVRQEFRERHFLIQSLVRVCRGRPSLTWIASSALKLAADAATLLRASNIERRPYSGLFSLDGLFNEFDDVHFLFNDLENPIERPLVRVKRDAK